MIKSKNKKLHKFRYLIEVNAESCQANIIYEKLNASKKPGEPHYRIHDLYPMQEKALDVFGEIETQLNSLRDDLNSHERHHE